MQRNHSTNCTSLSFLPKTFTDYETTNSIMHVNNPLPPNEEKVKNERMQKESEGEVLDLPVRRGGDFLPNDQVLHTIAHGAFKGADQENSPGGQTVRQ